MNGHSTKYWRWPAECWFPANAQFKVARIEAHQRKVMLNVNLPQNGDLQA